MAGGQQITVSPGTLTPLGDEADALSGLETTLAAGSAAPARLLSLRSRKVGGGSAARTISGISTQALTGIALNGIEKTPVSQLVSATQGAFAQQRSRALTGSSVSMLQTSITGSGGSTDPVWSSFGALTFSIGQASTFSLPVVDPNGDPLTLTSVGTALPSGVTLDSDNRRLVWSGSGAIGTTTGHQIAADDGTGVAVTTFSLTSTSTQTAAPFMLGHAFRKGDVPSGVGLYVSEPNAHVVVKRRWNDGSVKHATIVGRTDLTANVAKTLTILKNGSRGGTALTSADIQSAAPSASVQCGAIGTVNLSSLLATPFRTWISTPEMVECHYRSAVGADASLMVWFHVRLWAGGRMWVRAVVENGYIGQTPGTKTYVPTVTIGGVTVYNNGGASLSHFEFTRWTAEGWIGGNPAVTPSHNPAYLMSTKLVPNYWKRSPTATDLNNLPQTYTPMALISGIEANVTSGGFGPYLGLIPKWEALYVTTGDARAFRSAVASASSWNLHAMARRPSSNRIARPSDYATTYLGSITINANGYVWDAAHAPNLGYVAYLATGDYFHLETMGFNAQTIYLAHPDNNGGGTSRLINGIQNRAVAWSQNVIGSYCAVAPLEDVPADDAAVVNEYRTLLENNWAYWIGQINLPGMNLLGIPYAYSLGGWEYGPSNAVNGSVAPWMTDFWVATNGLNSDREPVASMTNLIAVRDWMYRWIVGRFGPSGASSHHWSRAATYGTRVHPTSTGTVFGPDAREFYDSWGDVWTGVYGSPNAETTNLIDNSADLSSSVVRGYWANLLPAISYAVEHGATDSAAAWARFTGASNWATYEAGLHWSGDTWHNTPIWGVVPRGFGGT